MNKTIITAAILITIGTTGLTFSEYLKANDVKEPHGTNSFELALQSAKPGDDPRPNCAPYPLCKKDDQVNTRKDPA